MRFFPTRCPATVLFALALLAPVAAKCDGGGFVQCRPGPWGRIQYQTIYLAAPDTILDEFPLPQPQSLWCFPNSNADAVQALLLKAGIEKDVCDRLLADHRSKRDEEGNLSLYPTLADVEALKPEVRTALYRELAKSQMNVFYHDPAYIPGGNLDEWLVGTNLPDNVVQLIHKLAWKDGITTMFSDFRALLSLAASDSEARRWLKVLTRTRAVIAFLKVDSTDNLPVLKRYWSANFNRNDSLPLLKAMSDLPGGGVIDLTHLLPPIPRRLAYAYTTPDLDRMGQVPNCHWTSLNFFNYTRQNIYLNLKLAASQVLEDYDTVTDQATFGDILFFLDKDGGAYHSCVYLADDLVFTKNGENNVMPWIITRLDDVKELYLHDHPGAAIQVYRRRWPVESN